MPDDLPRTVQIPVRVANGEITFFYSGMRLRLREGEIGDLLLPDRAVGERMRSLLRREQAVTMFDAETMLWVNVRLQQMVARPRAEAPQWALEHLRRFEDAKPLTQDWFAPVDLHEPLRLLLRGSKLGELYGCSIMTPGFQDPRNLESNARSLNHAYSRISAICEPHRTSHTGNVFDKVFYFDEKERLQPISVRRDELAQQADYALAVLSVPWWLEDAPGLPRRWAHVGKMESGDWLVSVVDARSVVQQQFTFMAYEEALVALARLHFKCLPFDPGNHADWPPEPPYRLTDDKETELPWKHSVAREPLT